MIKRKKVSAIGFLVLFASCSSSNNSVMMSKQKESLIKDPLLRDGYDKYRVIKKMSQDNYDKLSSLESLSSDYYFHGKSSLEMGNSARAIQYLNFALMCTPSTPYSKVIKPTLNDAHNVYINSTLKLKNCDDIEERFSFLNEFSPDNAIKIKEYFSNCKFPKSNETKSVSVTDSFIIEIPKINKPVEKREFKSLEEQLDYQLRMKEYFPLYAIQLLRLQMHKGVGFQTYQPKILGSSGGYVTLGVPFELVLSDKVYESVSRNLTKLLSLPRSNTPLVFRGREIFTTKSIQQKLINLFYNEYDVGTYQRIAYKGALMRFKRDPYVAQAFWFPLFFLNGRYKVALEYNNNVKKYLYKDYVYDFLHNKPPICVSHSEDNSRQVHNHGLSLCSKQSTYKLELKREDIRGLKNIRIEYDIEYLYKKFLKE